MTKAEEKALKAYPMFGSEAKDIASGTLHHRSIYLQGYKQAEKDCIDDGFIKEIMSFTLSYCQRNGTLVSTEDIFKEWDKDEEDYINED